MQRPTKLSNYPWVVVRLDCTLCRRRGRYSLARLAARYGPEQDLDGLLRDLAASCPWWNERARKYEPRCGARFVDLEHDLPPRDLPPAVIAQRDRAESERLRQPRVHRPKLSDWHTIGLTIRCQRCGRNQMFGKMALLDTHGNVALEDLLVVLTVNCPRRTSGKISEWCEARFTTA